MIGAFASGIISDALYGQRTLTAIIFALAASPLLLILHQLPLSAMSIDNSDSDVSMFGMMMTKDFMFTTAKLCVLISGIAMSGPKTLLGERFDDLISTVSSI